jgi:hypothetical protein
MPVCYPPGALVIVAALLFFSVAALSGPRGASAAVRLELQETTVDATGMLLADRWRYDVKQLTATWSPPWGQATYRIEMPAVIDEGGAQARLSMTVAARGGRFAAGMQFNAEVEPASQVALSVLAEPGENKSETKTFTLKPRSAYSEGYSPVMQVRIGDGPVFYFRYKVVRDAEPSRPLPQTAGLCATPGIYLQREAISEDARGMLLSDQWTHDVNQGTASWSPPWGRATYRVELPAVIGPGGAEGRMSINVSAAGGRFAPGMQFNGEVEPSSQVEFSVLAEPGENKAQSKTFTLRPRSNYSENYSPTFQVRIGDGPVFYYRYKVVRCGAN